MLYEVITHFLGEEMGRPVLFGYHGRGESPLEEVDHLGFNLFQRAADQVFVRNNFV